MRFSEVGDLGVHKKRNCPFGPQARYVPSTVKSSRERTGEEELTEVSRLEASSATLKTCENGKKKAKTKSQEKTKTKIPVRMRENTSNMEAADAGSKPGAPPNVERDLTNISQTEREKTQGSGPSGDSILDDVAPMDTEETADDGEGFNYDIENEVSGVCDVSFESDRLESENSKPRRTRSTRRGPPPDRRRESQRDADGIEGIDLIELEDSGTDENLEPQPGPSGMSAAKLGFKHFNTIVDEDVRKENASRIKRRLLIHRTDGGSPGNKLGHQALSEIIIEEADFVADDNVVRTTITRDEYKVHYGVVIPLDVDVEKTARLRVKHYFIICPFCPFEISAHKNFLKHVAVHFGDFWRIFQDVFLQPPHRNFYLPQPGDKSNKKEQHRTDPAGSMLRCPFYAINGCPHLWVKSATGMDVHVLQYHGLMGKILHWRNFVPRRNHFEPIMQCFKWNEGFFGPGPFGIDNMKHLEGLAIRMRDGTNVTPRDFEHYCRITGQVFDPRYEPENSPAMAKWLEFLALMSVVTRHTILVKFRLEDSFPIQADPCFANIDSPSFNMDNYVTQVSLQSDQVDAGISNLLLDEDTEQTMSRQALQNPEELLGEICTCRCKKCNGKMNCYCPKCSPDKSCRTYVPEGADQILDNLVISNEEKQQDQPKASTSKENQESNIDSTMTFDGITVRELRERQIQQALDLFKKSPEVAKKYMEAVNRSRARSAGDGHENVDGGENDPEIPGFSEQSKARIKAAGESTFLEDATEELQGFFQQEEESTSSNLDLEGLIGAFLTEINRPDVAATPTLHFILRDYMKTQSRLWFREFMLEALRNVAMQGLARKMDKTLAQLHRNFVINEINTKALYKYNKKIKDKVEEQDTRVRDIRKKITEIDVVKVGAEKEKKTVVEVLEDVIGKHLALEARHELMERNSKKFNQNVIRANNDFGVREKKTLGTITNMGEDTCSTINLERKKQVAAIKKVREEETSPFLKRLEKETTKAVAMKNELKKTVRDSVEIVAKLADGIHDGIDQQNQLEQATGSVGIALQNITAAQNTAVDAIRQQEDASKANLVAESRRQEGIFSEKADEILAAQLQLKEGGVARAPLPENSSSFNPMEVGMQFSVRETEKEIEVRREISQPAIDRENRAHDEVERESRLQTHLDTRLDRERQGIVTQYSLAKNIHKGQYDNSSKGKSRLPPKDPARLGPQVVQVSDEDEEDVTIYELQRRLDREKELKRFQRAQKAQRDYETLKAVDRALSERRPNSNIREELLEEENRLLKIQMARILERPENRDNTIRLRGVAPDISRMDVSPERSVDSQFIDRESPESRFGSARGARYWTPHRENSPSEISPERRVVEETPKQRRRESMRTEADDILNTDYNYVRPNRENVRCRKCKIKGHIQKNCPTLRNRDGVRGTRDIPRNPVDKDRGNRELREDFTRQAISYLQDDSSKGSAKASKLSDLRYCLESKRKHENRGEGEGGARRRAKDKPRNRSREDEEVRDSSRSKSRSRSPRNQNE